jgi:hypothetical protein
MRRKMIEEKYPGGWAGFAATVPNKTLCADEEIVRVGFMTPSDVESYVRDLEDYGLQFQVDGKARDIAVAEQLRGLTTPCDWLEFGHVDLEDGSKRCSACRLSGSISTVLITPEGWQFEGSLSQTFGFVPSEHTDRSLKFLRHENGVDVYLNELTGKEVFVGRTSK